MKSSLVLSTMRVTPLSQVQKIILAEYGRTIMHLKLHQVKLMVDNRKNSY
jgi:hypothetical protein